MREVYDRREIEKADMSVRSEPSLGGFKVMAGRKHSGQAATTIYVHPRYIRNMAGNVVLQSLVIDVEHDDEQGYVSVEIRA